MDWRSRLNLFFDNFEWKSDVSGILVYGSQVTGGSTIHSNLNVHFVFDEKVNFRQKGCKMVESLLIDYRANTPTQIREMFQDDIRNRSLLSITQFASGEVFMERAGDVSQLKREASNLHREYYEKVPTKMMGTIDKKKIWEMKEHLAKSKFNGDLDFDFLHAVYLDRLVEMYMLHIGRPYSPKYILGNADDDRFRKKHMLNRLPDPPITELIASSITTHNLDRKLMLFTSLADKILEKFGGFEVDGFRIKTMLEMTTDKDNI